MRNSKFKQRSLGSYEQRKVLREDDPNQKKPFLFSHLMWNSKSILLGVVLMRLGLFCIVTFALTLGLADGTNAILVWGQLVLGIILLAASFWLEIQAGENTRKKNIPKDLREV